MLLCLIPSIRPPLAWSSPGKIDQSHGGVYNGALGAGKVDFSKRKNPPVIYLGHVRRWKKDAHFFKQASKIFDVDVVHRHPPQNNVRVGPIIYRLTVKPNRSSISADRVRLLAQHI
ncbi:hypothetical protein R1sor_017401 [Riccia sorocarpa]|uniref:Transposase n=1 Tax=Riccia sorocarpa TaxID=122646 RepID=A0ABD3ICZ6_9MARC